MEDFLKVCMCCRVVQGYGLTETCAASFIAVPDVPDHAGTVGPPQPVLSLRLEAVPEMNYDPTAVPPRGEVCVKGPAVFSGYYKGEDKTAEVLEADGWFHTGDIGELTATGALRIIDRKKNIFKLSQGEYIAVEKIEGVYGKSALVEQVFVYGERARAVGRRGGRRLPRRAGLPLCSRARLLWHRLSALTHPPHPHPPVQATRSRAAWWRSWCPLPRRSRPGPPRTAWTAPPSPISAAAQRPRPTCWRS